jgi:hypothetical protein
MLKYYSKSCLQTVILLGAFDALDIKKIDLQLSNK